MTRIPGITDSWFLGRYGMNLYRGCEHGCLYCDGRAERYHVPGDFARQITVKRNAVEVLDHQLSRVREPGFLFVGGGVSDAYQGAEARYELARGALKLALKHRLPVHVLTKSALVERDLDLLGRINEASRAVLSFSIQSLDEAVRERFEPEAASFEQRWALLAEARSMGLVTAVMAMPVLPGISDQAEAIEALVARAAEVGVDFICFGGLTLRPGVQKETYLEAISADYPEHLPGYERVYRSCHPSGGGDARYYDRIQQRFASALRNHGLAGRMPRRLFSGLIPRYTEAAVLLEHRAFERQLAGRSAPGLTRAGFALQTWARGRLARHRSRKYTYQMIEQELYKMLVDGSILKLKGMTGEAAAIVEEVLESAGPGSLG